MELCSQTAILGAAIQFRKKIDSVGALAGQYPNTEQETTELPKMSALTDASRDELIKIRTMVEALLEKSGVSADDVKKASKTKKASGEKKKGVPGWWSSFTKSYLSEHEAEWKAFAAAQPTKQGAHLKWLKENGVKDSEEAKAFKETWEAEHPKGETESVGDEESSAESVPSKASSGKRRGPPKKDEMTPEQLAKHEARIAENRAKKEAAKASGETAAKKEVAVAKPKVKATEPEPESEEDDEVEQPVAVVSKPSKTAAAPKPVAAAPKSAPKTVAAPKPAVKVPEVVEEAEEADEEEEADFLPFKLEKTKYFRRGMKDSAGKIVWSSGDLWEDENGEKGDYVGQLLKNGQINTEADEPMVF